MTIKQPVRFSPCRHTFPVHRGTDQLLLPVQPVVSLHHSGHRRGEVVFENHLAGAVTSSIDLECNGYDCLFICVTGNHFHRKHRTCSLKKKKHTQTI